MNLFRSCWLLFPIIISSSHGFLSLRIPESRRDLFVQQQPYRIASSSTSRTPLVPTSKKLVLCLSKKDSDNDNNDNALALKPIPSEMEGVAIPFVDAIENSFIECYADSVAQFDGMEYTIGVPCDHSVALCYLDDKGQLIPVELDDKLMDDIFPVAESIVAEEFGEELSLQRTPQTLTLVGELEDDDEDDDDDEEGDEATMAGEEEGDEEEVEVLLSFDHRGKEFSLVRLLDPILLVGKVDPTAPDNRILLTPQESDRIMPLLEEAFLDYHGYDETEEEEDDEEDDELLP